MSKQLVTAIEGEIQRLEAEIARDVRVVQLRELRKVLALYTDGSGATPATVATSARPVRFAGGSSDWAALNKLALAAHWTNAGRRRPSPERVAVVDAARAFLQDRGEPTPTREILHYLTTSGINVPGESPLNNLSAMLSNTLDFNSHGRAGWTLCGPIEMTTEQLLGDDSGPENEDETPDFLK